MPPDVPTCTKWLKGACKYGEQCRYSHQRGAATSKTSARSVASPPVTRTPQEQKARKQFFKNRDMMKNSGALLDEFELSKLQNTTTRPVQIQNCNFIASYNWCNSDEPAIFVPGCPAKWTPPSLPCQVSRDNGQVFMDQNNHRSPSASFDAFFKALLTMNPNFDMMPIGLATDRNSLRKLLRFVSGKIPESWRIDVGIVGNTMFFTRWEVHQVRIITGARDSGYGHGFEKAFLSFDPDLQESSGHHRIIRYELGGIKCLVRFEVDGYFDDGFSTDDQTSSIDELGQALSSLHVQTTTNPSAPSPAAEVKVIEKGRLVDNSTILELKSRSANLKLADIIPQLWISQTQHLYVGRHKEGLVEMEPEKMNMESHFTSWENKNQEHLSSLISLITDIKKVVKKAKGGKAMLICKMEEKPRVLRVYERTGETLFLPKGARDKCWGTEKQKQEGRA